LRMICEREAQQHPAIDADSVLLFIERLSTIARRSSDGLGSFAEKELSAVFQETCGFSPDDAARILISRLPTLGSVAAESGVRRFVDPDIADAARAGDVFRLIESPFDPNIRSSFKDAQRAISANGLERLSYVSESHKLQGAKLEVAVENALKEGISVAALDVLQLMMEWNIDYTKGRVDIAVESVIEGMSFDDEIPNFSRITFVECIFESLFIASNIGMERLPRFKKCLIGSLDGIAARGDLPTDVFVDCDVSELSNSIARNASILETDLPVASKVLLTVLNKLFNQAGRGRKENAFSRGLDPRARGLVPEILEIVESQGFATGNRIRNQTIWLPKRDKMRRVGDIISHPSSSNDPLIDHVRNL
jgi:hypothetical protein